MGPSNRTNIPPSVTPLISYAVLDVFVIVNDFAICCPINFLGVFANVANIIVYCKMGFAESSNVKFLSLAAFDLVISLVQFMNKIMNHPLTGTTATAISEITGLTLIVSLGGSAMMTALISTERYLCVVFPLKVRTLLTRRKSMYPLMVVIGYHFACLIVLYVDTNPPYFDYPEKLGFYIFYLYAVPSTVSFFLVVVTTLCLVVTLRRKQRWRRDTVAQTEKNSNKDNKLVKTIIAICIIFIACSIPTVGIFITQAVYPPFRYTDPYLGTLTLMIYRFSNVLQGISASVNIFFYYTMSSRFKKYFAEHILCKRIVMNEK